MTSRAELLARPYWTPAEAALILGRNKRTINRWIEDGLEAHDVRGRIYIRPEDVRAWASDPTRRTRRPHPG